MKKKPYMGIRGKALVAVVLLVLVPSLFLAFLTYTVKEDAVRTVRENAIRDMEAQIENSIKKLNDNASEGIENYLEQMVVEGESAGVHVKDHLGGSPEGVNAVWASKYLLTQLNTTALGEIMTGNLTNQYYTEMVNMVGKERVDSALSYFFMNLTMNYSSEHVNDAAYSAINEINEILMGNGSHALYSFLYSTMIPKEKEKLDYILPVGEMLYSFREVPEMLWSYFASEDSGFIVLTPYDAHFSPLFNPHVRKWYEKARDSGKPIWSGEYVDEITRKPMVTYSVPVYENGRLIGVLGFDILLSTLTKKTEQFFEGGKSFAFTVCRKGTALTHPDVRVLGNSLIDGNTEFNHTVREILNGTEGGMHTTINGERAFIAYSTINSTGWKFASVVYCSEILRKAEKTAGEIGNIVDHAIMYLLMIVVAVGLIGFIAAFFSADTIVREIKDITRIADEVSRGNLDVNTDIGAKDELGDLERSIKRMVNSIKVALEELERREK